MQIIRQAIEVEETSRGWILKRRGIEDVLYASAAEAAMAIKRKDEALAEETSDAAIVTVITWSPSTRLGRLVVKAITAPDKPRRNAP